MTLYEQVEIEANMFILKDKTLRVGQSYMLALNEISPYLYKVVSENDELDCFYLDRNIDRFKEFVNGGLK